MSTATANARISVVVPVYNESGGVAELLAELLPVLETSGYRYEVILVDDGSADDTWQRIGEQAALHPGVRGVRLSRNFGKEAALHAGLDSASGDAVVVMDGDLQHPPALIPALLEPWARGEAEVVDAVKQDRGRESFIGRLRALAFYRLLRHLSGFNLEGLSDFKLLDRKVVDQWLAMDERNRFFRGMIAWIGYRHVQVPFSVADRRAGTSSWSVWRLSLLAVSAITSFSALPLQISTMMGVAFAFAALILGAQTLYVWLSGNAVAGFTTVILLLLITSSLVLMSIGVIGEYVARIYHEVKRRPSFVVRERTDEP